MASLSSPLLKSLSSLSLKPQQNPSQQLPFPPYKSPSPSPSPSPSSSSPPQFLLISSTKPSTTTHQPLFNPLPKTPITNPQIFTTDHHCPSPPSVDSVICPSLAYANIFFFTENFRIICGENESEHEIAERFMRATARAGVFYEMKRRRFFQTPREEKKTKSQLAAKRLKRAKMRPSRFREVEPRKPKISIDPLEQKKRNARIAAKRRAAKKRLQGKGSKEKRELIMKKKESYTSDDDNWEFVDVEVPYS